MLTPEDLASTHALTPEPDPDCFIGQQLVIRWRLPSDCLADSLLLTVRYGTHQTDTFSYPLTSRSGTHVFRLIGQDYWCHQGIVSYKVTLYDGDTPLLEKRHHVWAELIEF